MAIKGITIPIGADSKEFNKEIKKVDRSIRGTVKEVQVLGKALDIEWNADQFEQAQKQAAKAIELTDVKVKALRDRLKRLDETKTDKQSAEYQKLTNQLVQTEAKAVLLKRQMDKIANLKLDALAGKFTKVGDSISKAGQKLAPFSVAAGGIIAGFGKIATGAIAAGDDIGTTAQQLNITTDALQKFNYIAQQTDVDLAKLRKSAIKVQEGVGKLATGETSKATEALEAIGITSEDAAKGMDENFETIILKLAAVSDATEQAALANQIFGAELGASMIPLLNDGAAGIQQLTEEFDSFNTLTNDQINDLDAFEDTMGKLTFQFEQQRNQLGSALLPLMETLAAIVQDKILPVVTRLTEMFANLTLKQQSLIFGVLAFITALAPMLLIIGKLTGSMGGVIKAVKGVRTALTFLAAHPIILVIAALVALMVLLYNTNEEFRNSIQELVKTLTSALMPILKIVGDLFNQIIEAILPLINLFLKVLGPVLTVVIKLFSFLIGIFLKLLIPYLKLVGKIWGEVFGFIPKIIEGVVQSVEWMVNSIIGLVNGLIKKINSIGKYVGFTINEIQKVEFELGDSDIFGGELETSSAPGEAEDIGQLPTQQEETAGIPDNLLNRTNTSTETTAEDQISQTPSVLEAGYGGPVVDNSSKQIEINVTVENYAQEIDVDDMIQQINVKLAEAM